MAPLEGSSSCGIPPPAQAPEETPCPGCKSALPLRKEATLHTVVMLPEDTDDGWQWCCLTGLQLVTQLYEEQKSLAEALNTRNFNLAALNTNLIMHLNSLQTAGVPVALTAPPDSMHLRICLPG